VCVCGGGGVCHYAHTRSRARAHVRKDIMTSMQHLSDKIGNEKEIFLHILYICICICILHLEILNRLVTTQPVLNIKDLQNIYKIRLNTLSKYFINNFVHLDSTNHKHLS